MKLCKLVLVLAVSLLSTVRSFGGLSVPSASDTPTDSVTGVTQPAGAEAYIARGDAHWDNEAYDSAFACYNEAVRIDPNSAKAYYNRGFAYMYVNKCAYDSAMMDFNEAIRLDSNYGAPYYGRGIVYERNKEYDSAIINYTEAIRLDTNHAGAYSSRGDAYWKKGDRKKAIKDYNTAVRLDSTDADTFYGLAFAYSQKGNIKKAIANYNAAIRYDSTNACLYDSRGLEYERNGESDKAVADYSAAIRLDSNYAFAYINRGYVYGAKGEFDSAVSDFTKGLRFAVDVSDSTSAYYGRGVAYRKKGDLDLAIADLSEAIRLDTAGYNYRARGWAYIKKGKFKSAALDFLANNTVHWISLIITACYFISLVVEYLKVKKNVSQLNILPEIKKRMFIKDVSLVFISVACGAILRILDGDDLGELLVVSGILFILIIMFHIITFMKNKRMDVSVKLSGCIDRVSIDLLWILWLVGIGYIITATYINPDAVFYGWEHYISIGGLTLLSNVLLVIGKIVFTVINYTRKTKSE